MVGGEKQDNRQDHRRDNTTSKTRERGEEGRGGEVR